MSLPKVSIVIPFYNCEYIDQAIQSAINQTYSNKEVIVVNDGATLHAEKIKPYLDRILYLEKENGGTASAVNLGIRHATGDYFSWLSSDDLFVPSKTARQMNFMLKNKADVSHTNYHIIDKDSKITKQRGGLCIQGRAAFFKNLQTTCHINGCTVVMKMNLFRRAGLFNEALSYTQDYDMWLRVLHHAEFHCLDVPLVLHRYHEEMGSVTHHKELWEEFHQVRNKYHSFLQERSSIGKN